MKIKTILITVAVLGAAGTGSVFGVRSLLASAQTPVQVAPVINLAVDMSYEDEESSISGNVLSMDTQNVELMQEDGITIKKVYVKPGDTVKKGDKLLEYDMTMVELQRELKSLELQINELELQAARKNLETLLKNPGAASASALLDEEDDDDLTASADDLIISEDALTGGEDEDPFEDSEEDPFEDPDPFEDEEEPFLEDEAEDWEDFQDPALIDDDTAGAGGEGETNQDQGKSSAIEDMIDVKDPDRAREGEITQQEEDINEDALGFIRRVNTMNSGGNTPSMVSQDFMDETFLLFEGKLAQTAGDSTAEAVHYVLKDSVVEALSARGADYSGDTFDYPTAMQVSLFRAYGNLCLFQLQKKMSALEQALAGIDVSDNAQVLTLQGQIEDAAAAYLKLQHALSGISAELMKLGEDESAQTLLEIYESHLKAYGGEDMNLADPAQGSLSRILGWLNRAQNQNVTPAQTEEVPLVDDPEPATETEMQSEPYDWDDFGGDDFDDADDGSDYSAEDYAEDVAEAKSAIADLELDLKEKQLELDKLDRTLAQRIVTASLDGVVKSVGETESYGDDYYIILSGEKGMYVQGRINELARENIQVGDTVTGISYETDASFTATITEISPYPVTDEDGYGGYYGFSSDNPNASFYPFTAYIAEADDLTEGDAELRLGRKETDSGLYLENYFIRRDDSGKYYVMIKGEDGLLKKQIVKTGKSKWGIYTQITAGLTRSDEIAFPYGKDVVEGAKTLSVEQLEDM